MNKSIQNKDDFYTQWEKKREKKWLYILLIGVVIVGIPVGSLFYFLHIHYSSTAFHLSDYLEKLITTSFITSIVVYLDFNRREKAYLNRDNDKTDD